MKEPGMFSSKDAKAAWEKAKNEDYDSIKDETYAAMKEFLNEQVGDDAYATIDYTWDCPKRLSWSTKTKGMTYLKLWKKNEKDREMLKKHFQNKGKDKELSISRYLPMFAKESTRKNKMKFRKIVKESEKFDKWEYRELIDRV
jgi:hypothetical protein